MPTSNSWEHKFRWLQIPHLLLILLAGQVLVYFATTTKLVTADQLYLRGMYVLDGEFWRVFTFLLVPLQSSPLWFALGVYVTWLIGTALESQWGELRFCLFILCGWASTVICAFLFPGINITNLYIFAVLTLAFARLYPNVEFLIFFVLPVKVKYIAWLWWLMYALAFLSGNLAERSILLASLVPYLLFFGPETFRNAQNRKRAHEFRRDASPQSAETHRCSVCGITNLDDPNLEFRYRNGECICETCLQKEKNS